jgi:GAF domain-containing protein
MVLGEDPNAILARLNTSDTDQLCRTSFWIWEMCWAVILGHTSAAEALLAMIEPVLVTSMAGMTPFFDFHWIKPMVLSRCYRKHALHAAPARAASPKTFATSHRSHSPLALSKSPRPKPASLSSSGSTASASSPGSSPITSNRRGVASAPSSRALPSVSVSSSASTIPSATPSAAASASAGAAPLSGGAPAPRAGSPALSLTEVVAAMQACEKKLQSWSEVSGSALAVHGARLALVRGEIAGLQGRSTEALAYYEQAINSARTQGMTHIVALSLERSAETLAAMGAHSLATAALKESAVEYMRFGATVKVARMCAVHPAIQHCVELQPKQLLLSGLRDSSDDSPLFPVRSLAARIGTDAGTPKHHTIADNAKSSAAAVVEPSADSETGADVAGGRDSVSTQLNISFLIQCTRLLSSDLELSKLLERFMQFVLQLGGATSGLLFLSGPEGSSGAAGGGSAPAPASASGSGAASGSVSPSEFDASRAGSESFARAAIDSQLYLACACDVSSDRKSWIEKSTPWHELPRDRFAHSVVEYVLRSGHEVVVDNEPNAPIVHTHVSSTRTGVRPSSIAASLAAVAPPPAPTPAPAPPGSPLPFTTPSSPLLTSFSEDAYLTTKKAKSLVCIPLKNRKVMVGVLYLENSLSTGFFRHEHIKLLKVQPSSPFTAACCSLAVARRALCVVLW